MTVAVKPMIFPYAQYVAMGYEPLTIAPNAKFPAVLSGGIWSGMQDWTSRNTALAAVLDLAQIWENLTPPCGIGIRTGRVCAIDLDILHPELAKVFLEAVTRIVGASPYVRIGLAPKSMVFFRTDRPLKKMASALFEHEGHRCQIEIQGEGQQVVVQGIHEKTHKPYQWLGPHIAEVRFEDLPTATEDTCRALIDEFNRVLTECGATVVTKARDANSAFSSSNPIGSLTNVTSAMAHLSNDDRHYDQWIAIMFAVKRALQKEECGGKGIFHDWSAKASKYDFEKTDTAWDEGDLDDREVKAGAGSIFYLARQEGWDWPRSSANEDFEPVDVDELEFKPPAKAETPWPDPADVFNAPLDMGLPDLPTKALPGVIDDFARDVGERFGVEPGAVAAACIAVAASCVDDGIKLQPKRFDTSYTERPCLWIALVADPGGMKTPVIRAAVEPLRALENRWAIEDLAVHTAYAMAMKIYAAREKDFVRDPHGKPPTLPIKPPRRRALVNDATMEALSDILPDNPRGILGYYDELAALFGSIDAYRDGKGRDRQDILELYNGGAHTIDRIGRGHIPVPNWSMGMLGGIQPKRLADLAPKISDDGLAQRFLFVAVRPVGGGIDRCPDAAKTAAYVELLRDLKNLAADNCAAVRLCEEAQHFREKISCLREALCFLPEAGEAFKGFAQKLDGFFARLVIIFHVIESVSLLGFEPTDEVPVATVERAYRFLTRFLLPHSMHTHRTLFGKAGSEEGAKWVAGFILSHRSETVTASELKRANRALRDAPGEIVKTMHALQALGWCRLADPSRRDSAKWEINPAVHEAFAAQGDRERERRAAEMAKIRRAVVDVGDLKASL